MYELIGETDMSLQQIEIINLNNKLELASFFYHVLSKPELEDEVYDQLFHKLLDLEKQYPEFKVEGGITSRVGNIPLEGLVKVKHTKPLLSLKNVFDVNDIIKELPLVHEKVSYIANAKLDGVALSLIYRDGKLNARATPSTGGTATTDPNARDTPSTGSNPIEIQNDVNQYGMNTQANVSAANRVVNDLNMAQIQQLFQLLNANPDLVG